MNNAQIQSDLDFTGQVATLISGNGSPSLAELWKKLDGRAKAKVIDFVGHYVGRNSEKEEGMVKERRQRGVTLNLALDKQIAVLRKAYKARAAFEELEWEGYGKIADFGNPLLPNEYGPLSAILSMELLRLIRLRGQTTNAFNQKRMGVAGKHYWLVIAQDFVHDWTALHLGEARNLTPQHLAKLIDAARKAMGQEEEHEFTDPEDVGKAVRRFRKNPLNKDFCERIPRNFYGWGFYL